MRYWKFKVFINNNGRNDFEKWLDRLAPKDCFKIDQTIKYLEINKIWNRPQFDKLESYDKLHEIRISGQNSIQIRIFGCFGPQRREFTILLGAIKKNSHYNPKNALKLANKRSKLIQERGRVNDY